MPSQAALDLAWAINSPSLVDGEDVAITQRIEAENIDAEHLAHFLRNQPKSRSVGRYFEHLVHYWLAHVRKVEVAETNLQLKEGKITVGEIDFLYRNENSQLVHLETSVKFYLHTAGMTPSEYPGPNARDNFESKAAKLFNQQLPASDGRIDDVSSREGLVKGMIFYPEDSTNPQAPDRLAADHSAGRWVRSDSVGDLEPLGDIFSIAEKPHWLAPSCHTPTLRLGQLAERLSHHFSTKAHPVMLSIRNTASPEVEQHRCLIVSPSWPARTST